MSKLTRVTHTIFGGSAPAAANGIAQFGSKQAGTPTYTTNIATLQALAAWLNGWGSAVVSGKVPPLEELNAAFLEPSYQIGYLFEMGIPEWDSGTTYFTNSYVQIGGVIYKSLIDNNLNNSPTSSPADWTPAGGGNVWWGGNLGAESTTTQLNLTIPGFPANSQIPTGTIINVFVGVAFGSTITGGCTVAINGGTPIVINTYQATAISASTTVTLARLFQLFYNGVGWMLQYNPQNDGVLAPSVTGTQNNYNPTGFGVGVTVLKLNTTGVTTITGLTTGLTQPNGWEITVVNIGSSNATLSNLSGSSSVGNRIAVYNSADYVLAPGNFCKLRYSVADSEWFLHP